MVLFGSFLDSIIASLMNYLPLRTDIVNLLIPLEIPTTVYLIKTNDLTKFVDYCDIKKRNHKSCFWLSFLGGKIFDYIQNVQ